MITRDLQPELLRAAAEYPVVTLLGPRQSGKTTLARMAFPDKPWVSLEDPDVRLSAAADPRGFLAQYAQGAILDEVQRLPELLSYLQGWVDRDPTAKGRFILTGNHQPRLPAAIGQSLAGRTAVLTLWPLTVPELRQYGRALNVWDLVVRGSYPRVHEDALDARRFYASYVQTYVERDVRALVQLRDLTLFQKFLVLLAGRVGQVVNLSSLGNDAGVTTPTLRQWLSVLQASFLVLPLTPYHANVGKRVIKSPKLYFADVGLAAYLLGIQTAEQAQRDPLRGALYENLWVAEIWKQLAHQGEAPDLHFYRDSNGNEVDLLVRQGGRLHALEIKSAATFTPGFCTGITRFQTVTAEPLASAQVWFDGTQRHTVHGVVASNPLNADAPAPWLKAVVSSPP